VPMGRGGWVLAAEGTWAGVGTAGVADRDDADAVGSSVGVCGESGGSGLAAAEAVVLLVVLVVVDGWSLGLTCAEGTEASPPEVLVGGAVNGVGAVGGGGTSPRAKAGGGISGS